MSETIKLPLLLRILREYNFPRKLGILERLYGRHLNKHGVCWVLCSNGVKWKLDLTDPGHRWIVFGMYEGGRGIDYARSQLKDGGVYVDSGANIGQWLLYLGSIPGLRSLAFEPVGSEREWLKECLDHQSKWDTQIIDCGLGSAKAELEIQVHGSRSTLHLDWYVGKNLPKITISMDRLDDVLEQNEVTQVDFWKLDVEGAELEALKGAKEMLKKTKNRMHIFRVSSYELQSDCSAFECI